MIKERSVNGALGNKNDQTAPVENLCPRESQQQHGVMRGGIDEPNNDEASVATEATNPSLRATDLCTFNASMLGSTVDHEDDNLSKVNERENIENNSGRDSNCQSDIRIKSVQKNYRIHPMDEEAGHKVPRSTRNGQRTESMGIRQHQETRDSLPLGCTPRSRSVNEYSNSKYSQGLSNTRSLEVHRGKGSNANAIKQSHVKFALQVVSFFASLGLMLVTIKKWKTFSMPEQLILWSFANNLMVFSVILLFL